MIRKPQDLVQKFFTCQFLSTGAIVGRNFTMGGIRTLKNKTLKSLRKPQFRLTPLCTKITLGQIIRN